MTLLHISTPWLMAIATLIGAAVIWFVVSMVSTKGGSGLYVLFVLFAGGGSTLLSLRYPQWAWLIFVAAMVIAVLVRIVFHKLGINLKGTTITWSQYLKGQGVLLFFFLFVGGGFAWLSVTYGPYPGRISKGGQLLKFEDLDPSQHPVYEEVDVENYSQISVYTRAGTKTGASPANGSATVTIYLDHGAGGKLEYGQLDSESASWSRWDQANTGKRMSLVAGPPTVPGAIPATQVDILVYLSPK